MKNIFTILLIIISINISFAQNDTISKIDTNTYRITKTDGGILIGKIISQDEREIYISLNDNRRIYIPQHTVKEIEILNLNDFNIKGHFIGEDKFATRYFITTNGLPIKKGEHYIQWNLYGPDFQFALGNDLGIGVMTSWFGLPIVGTIKKSWTLGSHSQLALGGLLSTGSWAAPDLGGALPFGALSFGDRQKNIAISGGYGAVWYDGDLEGRALTSLAGMIKITPKLSLVFDSFILLPGDFENKTIYKEMSVLNNNTGQYEYQTIPQTIRARKSGFAVFIPGLRWHQNAGKAFQFGFTGLVYDNELVPMPIPTVQWFRSL